ncbi:MAG: histidine kinase, partial [Alphaproteobacteria bacterium]|nr:histidine kinase [Alphaproteobacteria bacterium]
MGEVQVSVAVALAAVAALVIAAGALLWWQHRLWRVAERARDTARAKAEMVDAMLEAAPEGFFVWGHGAGDDANGRCSRRLAVLLDLIRGRDSTFDDVVESLEALSQTTLRDAIEALRTTGVGFALELTLASGGRRVAARGLRAANGESQPLADVVWMSDVTEGAAAVEALNREGAGHRRANSLLKAALDGIEVPVWVRDDDLSLIYCNR